jgi:hypothetical protein
MIYRPQHGDLWDAWVFPWQGRYHLFHLHQFGGPFDGVGRAVSEDLVHWQPLPTIPTRGRPGTWNAENTCTGTTLHHGGQFYLFVTSYSWEDGLEKIGFFVSPDLEKWTEFPGNPVDWSGPPHYSAGPQDAPYTPVDWRDPAIVERDGWFHAAICARRAGWSDDDTAAVVGHTRSRVLVHWEKLAPFVNCGRFSYHCEVPDLFEWRGRHYVTWNTASAGGVRVNTPFRDEVVGVFHALGDRFEGPYRMPEDPFVVGGFRDFPGAYSGRSVPWGEDERVVYHVVGGDAGRGVRPAFGSPKRLRQEADGSLSAHWFPGLQGLETGVLVQPDGELPPCQCRDQGRWWRDGNRFRGRAQATGTSCVLASGLSRGHISLRLRAQAARAGLVLRSRPNQPGLSFLLDFERRLVTVGHTIPLDTVYGPKQKWIGLLGSVHCLTQGAVRQALPCDREYHLRALFRETHFELYLDDRWVFSTGLGDTAAEGDAELYLERGEVEASAIRVAVLEPWN